MSDLLNLNSKTKMKINVSLLNIALAALLPTGFVQAQSSPAAKASPPRVGRVLDTRHYTGRAAPRFGLGQNRDGATRARHYTSGQQGLSG